MAQIDAPSVEERARTPDLGGEAAIVVPFCKPDYGDKELAYLSEAINVGRLEGGGSFTQKCEAWLEAEIGCPRALLVPSCTAALEMMAFALDIQPGDEVIMPSYTFVSTANAIALRGGVPVFVDVDPRTLNIDPAAAEAAVTPRTRAVMVVHYAGVGCDMDALEALCARRGLVLLEDAAQALGAAWGGRALGGIGAFGAFSFHHTKNVTCGEGGALIVNDVAQVQACEHIRDKGTDRSDYLRRVRTKYEWVRLGSSYLLSELAAAVLRRQLERSGELMDKRLALWRRYDAELGPVAQIRTPHIPGPAEHNGHIYHLRLPDSRLRDALAAAYRRQGVIAAPHFVALHLTPGGRRFGRPHGDLAHTLDAEATLLRLPLYSSMSVDEQDRVLDIAHRFASEHRLD